MTEVIEFCNLHGACRDGEEWASQFATLAEVYDKCERGDWLIWLLRKADKLNKLTAVKIAIECADHVLRFYEEKYPNDKRPRLAIEAARKYLAEPTEENRSASSAAYAAAYAAYAAAAAASAASSAASAASSAVSSAASSAASSAVSFAASAASAASTASSAASAAYFAASAAYFADERKWQADKIREIIGVNPFN